MPAPTLRDILPPSPEQLQQQLIGDNQLYRGFATGIKGVTSGSLANDALNAESNGGANAASLRDQALASQQAAAAYAPRVSSLRNIRGIGDAVDYGLGAVGQGVASMAPTIAAAALTRVPGGGAALSRATSYAGAAGAGYLQEKGEAALGQYSDPTLAATPVAERQRAATTKGLVNAALEGIVPAGLTSMVGKNGVGRIMAKDFVTEGATEAAQQYVGHLADKSLDATRQLDPWDIADAFAGGALSGGAVGAVHGAAHKLATGPKDFVTSTRAAIEDAGANAPTPTDFLKSVFKPGPSVDLDPVAAGDAHPDLVDAVTKAGDSAGEVLDGLTAKRGEMAASYAEEILNDPNTPAAVKQTIMDMGGDYESPTNQAALGAQYVGRKASEAASSAADFVKGMAPKVSEAAKGFVTGVQDRITKKNLQGGPVTEDETFALHKDIIDNLKPEAKRRTDVIADMPQLAAGIAGALNKYGAVKTAPTDKNIQELQHLYSAATTLFDKPEAVFAKLASKVEAQREGAKKPTPFSDLLAGVTTAQQDVGKNEGSSYLQTRLVAPMGPAEVKQLARFVDEFGMTDTKNSKQADKVLDGLAVAFGGKQEALQVLDYYSRANRLNAKQLLQYDANELLDPESGVQATDLKPTRTYSFADPKTNRPFRSAERLAKLDAQSLREGSVASDSAKVTTIPYSQYVDETGKDHKAEVVRIMNDVKGRQDKAYAGYAAELGIKGTPEAKLAAARNAALERRASPDAKSTRLVDIDRLQGELDMARAAYKEGGPKAVLDLYEVNAAEQNEKNDLVATDEDVKAMATNKNDEDMVSFTKADGTKMVLSSKSMARTQAAKEKATGQAARGEGGTTREARLLKEAIASVLAREDIKGMDEKTAPPTLKTFPRSKDTKAALKEQEASVAELKKRTDEAAREYEDNDDPESRDKIRTGIERNIARLQSQYEAAEGAAPLRAVIRQRQAVYKEALAAINDVDFQERVDQREKDGPDTATERTEPTGVRTSEEDTGDQLGALGDLKKPTRSEDRIFKKSLQGVGVPSDKLIDAVNDVVMNENYARLDTPEKVLAFTRAAKQVLTHLQGMGFEQWQAADENRMRLRDQLEQNFDQSGASAFDWHSLFDNEGTKADLAEMDRIVKQSKQDARTGLGSNPDKTQQEALDEIARIRGADVAVAFARMAQIKGSGDFSMNKDKTERLIRLAVDGANMKSTAWHESLHDFIAMLGGTPQERAIKRDMLNTTNTPHINAKLRELLKDHPAALKQLSDPEERLAYVYQFWAEGALKLTPEAGTLLGRIAEFIQNLLGIVSQDGKLDAQLAALHRGELVEPGTVARVLDNLDAKTVRDKLESLAGPLADGLGRVFTSATDRLRKPGVESLDKLAGLFHKDPGHESGEGGMLQRRAQKEGQFSNAYQKLVEGTAAAERLNALNNLQAMKPPQGALELGLTKLLDDMYTYMTEAGVATFNKETKKWDPVRRVANYFPRSWDGESIRKDVAGFKALLTANGVSVQQADATIDMLTKSGNDQFDLAENDKALGFVPLAVHVNDRVFTFITPTNADLFAKYQNKDVTDIMTTYIRQASHRGEYARSFGNNGEVIEELLKKAREEGMTHAEEANILPTIRGLEGTLGHDMNPEMKKIMSGVITVENVILMPMAIFSQMVDPIGIAMRTNSVKDAGAAYLQSLKDLRKAITRDNSYDYDRELTKMLGIISTDSMLETMGQTQGSMYMTSTMRHINQKFFRYNGMEGWNNSMRVAATVAGERYLLANVGNERAMTELNVDPKNVKVMPEGTNWGESGRMAITKEQFEHLGMQPDEAQTAAEQIQEAMFRFVDGAVVRPNAAHRATWMSDPRFQLLSHLKQFTFSFQSAVLNRARNEYIHGNSTPMLLLSMTVPIMLASDIAKWAMTGTLPANWTAFDYMAHAVVRSGILGKYEYAARGLEDAARGNVPGLSFAGPTVEHANILAQWVAGAPGASSDRVMNRSIPLARYA